MTNIFEDDIILSHKLYENFNVGMKLIMNLLQPAIDENRKLTDKELLQLQRIIAVNIDKANIKQLESNLENTNADWWYYYGGQVANCLRTASKEPLNQNSVDIL